MRKKLNRLEYLQDLKNQEVYNLICYSKDSIGEKPKSEYIKQWQNQKEKIELIDDLIEESKEHKKFKLYTTMYSLYNNLENKTNSILAILNDYEKGLSVYLTSRDNNHNYYELIYSIHNKKKYHEEYESIAAQTINKEMFINKEKLKSAMSNGLKQFEEIIENDKRTSKRYEKYYEEENTIPTYYVINSDKDVIYSSYSLQDAIINAEKSKRKYIRECDNMDVWVESDQYDGKIYEAIGYKEEEEFE